MKTVVHESDYIWDRSHDAPYWKCSLFGCELNNYGACEICGAELYGDLNFVQQGIIPRVVCFVLSVVAAVTWHKCDVCGHPTGFGKNAPYCCSEECSEKWLPF